MGFSARRYSSQRITSVLLVLLPICIFLGLSSGAVPISIGDLTSGLWQIITGQPHDQAAVILGQIRLPRVLLAAVVGAILASSGAAMQGLFRNPLADPSLIGVTAGASLGASLMIVAGGSIAGVPYFNDWLGLSLVTFGAFVGGLVAVLLVYKLATSSDGTSVATMLLAGIAITALASSLTNLLEFYADNDVLRRISLWRMGGLDGANYPRLLIACAVFVGMLMTIPQFCTALNALLLGESEARHLGINIGKTKFSLIVVVAIAVGTAVALAGTIAFVGLIVPHMVRMLTGPDHHRLIPASALAGACLLVLADAAARVVLAPTELPVGVVTALIGVPFFISLLRNRREYAMQ